MSTALGDRRGTAQQQLNQVQHLITCRTVRDADDLAAHRSIRQKVFVDEQAVFEGSDHDCRDDDPATTHILGWVDAAPCGAVRIYRLEPGSDTWQGDRLAVLRSARVHGLGGPLVRYAVAAAGVAGGQSMVAHVQVQNVLFFKHLGWTPEGPEEIYVGRPHQQMRIELPTPRVGASTLAALEGVVSRVDADR